MRELHFQGCSDDTFGEYNHFKDDYNCCASGKPIVYRLEAGRTGMYVFGQYDGQHWPKALPGCWMIGVQQLDEDIDLPWPIRFEQGDRCYTSRLVVEAPDDVQMICMNLATSST